jgi:putative SOS response-associated peptidase YedK
VQPLFGHDEPVRHSPAVRAINSNVGNLPPMPGIFPDCPATEVRSADGERELVMMRWGMPPPPKLGAPPVTNIRNSPSPHRRAWLKPENRCLIPVNSYAEYAPEPNPATGKKDVVWFALHDDRPLFENLDRSGSTAQLWMRADNRAGPKQRRYHDSTCKNCRHDRCCNIRAPA